MNTDSGHVTRLFYLAKGGAVYVDDPSLIEVLDALMKLDGRDVDTLSISFSNGASMDVGGGHGDQYKCHARTSGGFFDLVDPLIPRDIADTLDIQMNDEINTFPRCSIISLKTVKNAVECFYLDGRLSSEVKWDSTLEYEPL